MTVIQIGTSLFHRIRQRISLSRAQLLIIVGIAVLLAMPLTRQITADYGLPFYLSPLLWGALSLAFLITLLPIRLLARRAFVELQARKPVFRYWLLLRALVYRDLRARYARSTLGWPWIIVQPLFQMVVYTLLRAILGITGTGGMNFVMFLYTAILPWNFIATAVNTSAPSVFANSGLLKKMPIPREIFVLAAIITALVDFAMGLAVLVVMITFLAVPLTWNLLWLPILLLVAIGLGLAVGLIVAAVVPFRGDVNLLIPYVMQLWFFLTPVFYSTDTLSPRIRALINLNPAVGLISGFRNVLGAGLPPDPVALAWSTVFTLLLLAVSWPFFRHMARYFADMM